MLQPGDRLRDYEIVTLLGEGAFGAVYQARHVALDRMHAVKMLLQTTADPTEWDRLQVQFLDEARLLSRLAHPRLAAVSDFFQELHPSVGYRTAFMVMACIDGETLENHVTRTGPLPESTVLEWARQICSILEYLHERPEPVTVRDLKPANLMLSADHIHLVDFGIAKCGPPACATKTILRYQGTPGFCPPEQYRGGTTPRSDYYALGATMLFLLTGQVPPEASERENLRTPLPLPPHVSRPTLDAIEKLMQLRLEDRPANAQAVHHLLPATGGTRPLSPRQQQASSSPLPPNPPPGTAPSRAVRRSSLVRVAGISTGLVMAATGLLWQVRPSVVPPVPSPSAALPSSASPTVETGEELRRDPHRFPPTSGYTAKVVGVPSGDTVEVQHESTRKQVRLFDIDSPDQGQAHGDASRAELSRLALGRTVGIAVMKDQDAFGRTAAYVTLPDGTDLSYTLARRGCTWRYEGYSDDEHLAALQARAKSEHKGLWADAAPLPPWDFRHQRP